MSEITMPGQQPKSFGAYVIAPTSSHRPDLNWTVRGPGVLVSSPSEYNATLCAVAANAGYQAGLNAAEADLKQAVEYGQGGGAWANALLWNAGGILIEFGRDNNRPHIEQMGRELRAKGELEHKALVKANGGEA